MSNPIYVTGMGIVSALGVGKEATLLSLKKGESGIGELRYLDTTHREFPAGEVKFSNAQLAEMTGCKYPESGLRTVMLGILAVREAISEAGLTPEEIRQTPFVNGTTVGGMDKTERHFQKVFDSEAETDEAKELLYNDCGCSSELIASSVGKFAMVTTTSTACSSAANAIILGANMIKSGIAEIVVAGGSEALTRFHLNGFNTLMILDKEQCRPFDKNRSGINLGEGAAYIVLESEESARRRKASVIAGLSGYGNACDAFHQTASSETGEGAFLAVSKALKMAELLPGDIDYINAHGTGTPNNDITELAAMQRIWGEQIPSFSSTKGLTGHTTSASGAIEAVISIMAIQNGLLPGNFGWREAISPGLEPISENRYSQSINHVIDNSFGFGGNDSSLIFSKIGE